MSPQKGNIPWNKGKTMEIKAGENYKYKDCLQKEYWDKGLSICKIAKNFGLNNKTILYWMEKLDISRRSQADIPTKYSVDESIFEKCDTHEKAYWLGFIMADGYVTESGRTHYLGIGLRARDKNHLEKFREFLSSNVPIKERWETNNFGRHKTATIRIYRKKIIEDLERYGVVPRKTGKEQIKNIPKQYYPDFIRGYFDGDGWFSIDKYRHRNAPRFGVVCASKLFLQKIQNILIKNCNLSQTRIYKKGVHCYRLDYGGRLQVPRILSYLLQNSNVKLERKYKELYSYV